MKIIMIECTAEELSANRTVIDNINNALNKFTESMFGVNSIDFARSMLENYNEGEEE